MFYFLICQSSITEYYDTEKKYITSFFWGTVAYIFTHALFSSSDTPLAIQLKKSFWLLVMVDLGSLFYMYYNIKNKESADSDSSLVDDLIRNFSIKLDRDIENMDSDDEDSSDEATLRDGVKGVLPCSGKTDDENRKKKEIEPDIINKEKETLKTIKENIHSTDLIIPPSNEHNLDYPETSTPTSKSSYSTPISSLIDNNYVDEPKHINKKEDNITFDITFDEEDDSGSDIDIESFNDFIK